MAIRNIKSLSSISKSLCFYKNRKLLCTVKKKNLKSLTYTSLESALGCLKAVFLGVSWRGGMRHREQAGVLVCEDQSCF